MINYLAWADSPAVVAERDLVRPLNPNCSFTGEQLLLLRPWSWPKTAGDANPGRQVRSVSASPGSRSGELTCSLGCRAIKGDRLLYCSECQSDFCFPCADLVHAQTNLRTHQLLYIEKRVYDDVAWPAPAPPAAPAPGGPMTSIGSCSFDEKHSVSSEEGVMSCADCGPNRHLCFKCDNMVHVGARAEHKRRTLLPPPPPPMAKQCENDCNKDAVLECGDCKSESTLCLDCDAAIHKAPSRKAHTRRPLGKSPVVVYSCVYEYEWEMDGWVDYRCSSFSVTFQIESGCGAQQRSPILTY